jgi:toxin FitB
LKYLLDTNVLKEVSRPDPHENVTAWLDSVDDSDLAISVISVREITKGIEKKRKTDEGAANTLAAAADQIFAAYADRIIAIDEAIARCCGRSLGLSDKHIDDTGLAATAEVKGLIIVTRNQADFQGRGVTILNPFKKPPDVISPQS